jgi:hypothetical protein
MRLATLLLVVLSVQNASAGESVYDRCIRAAEERDTATVIFSAQLMLSSVRHLSILSEFLVGILEQLVLALH